MRTREIVNTLKENNQDFEWYPTTEEIIESINQDVLKTKSPFENFSILDVGAGNQAKRKSSIILKMVSLNCLEK